MTTTLELAGLTTHLHGPSDAATTCVLLHGFGAPGTDLVSLARELAAPGVRFAFPEAPLALGGMYGDGRAWWHLDLAQIEAELRRGTPRDRRAEIPEGLVEAREQLGRLLDELAARFAGPDGAPGRVVLGGFSQGAMLALDVALHRAVPPTGLLLMSGTLLAESEWTPRMASLRGVRVLQSHGRADPLLSFAIAEQLRDLLRAAGAEVDWHEFAGGHQIPGSVLHAAAQLLRGAP